MVSKFHWNFCYPKTSPKQISMSMCVGQCMTLSKVPLCQMSNTILVNRQLGWHAIRTTKVFGQHRVQQIFFFQARIGRDLKRVEEEEVFASEDTNRQRTGSGKQQNQESRSILTKTYSFKRMLSFRGSFRSRDPGSNPIIYNSILN